MKILEIKVMKGPNYWSANRHKLVVMLLDLEELEEESLDAFKRKYQALAEQARRQLVLGQLDTGTPEP